MIVKPDSLLRFYNGPGSPPSQQPLSTPTSPLTQSSPPTVDTTIPTILPIQAAYRRAPSPFEETGIGHKQTFSIPLISVTHDEGDDDDQPLSRRQRGTDVDGMGQMDGMDRGGQDGTWRANKARETREVVENVQSVLQQNIAGIDESPPSIKRRGRPLRPWYLKKWFILGATAVVVVILIIILVVVVVTQS